MFSEFSNNKKVNFLKISKNYNTFHNLWTIEIAWYFFVRSQHVLCSFEKSAFQCDWFFRCRCPYHLHPPTRGPQSGHLFGCQVPCPLPPPRSWPPCCNSWSRTAPGWHTSTLGPTVTVLASLPFVICLFPRSIRSNSFLHAVPARKHTVDNRTPYRCRPTNHRENSRKSKAPFVKLATLHTSIKLIKYMKCIIGI